MVERLGRGALVAEARNCIIDIDTCGPARARRIIAELGGTVVVTPDGRTDIPAARRSRIGKVLMTLLSKAGWNAFDKALERALDLLD